MSLTRAQKIIAESYRDSLSGPQARQMQDDWLVWLNANPGKTAWEFYGYILGRLSLPRRDALLNGDLKPPKRGLVENLNG